MNRRDVIKTALAALSTPVLSVPDTAFDYLAPEIIHTPKIDYYSYDDDCFHLSDGLVAKRASVVLGSTPLGRYVGELWGYLKGVPVLLEGKTQTAQLYRTKGGFTFNSHPADMARIKAMLTSVEVKLDEPRTLPRDS